MIAKIFSALRCWLTGEGAYSSESEVVTAILKANLGTAEAQYEGYRAYNESDPTYDDAGNREVVYAPRPIRTDFADLGLSTVTHVDSVPPRFRIVRKICLSGDNRRLKKEVARRIRREGWQVKVVVE